jgi:hypothetical protein
MAFVALAFDPAFVEQARNMGIRVPDVTVSNSADDSSTWSRFPWLLDELKDAVSCRNIERAMGFMDAHLLVDADDDTAGAAGDESATVLQAPSSASTAPTTAAGLEPWLVAGLGEAALRCHPWYAMGLVSLARNNDAVAAMNKLTVDALTAKALSAITGASGAGLPESFPAKLASKLHLEHPYGAVAVVSYLFKERAASGTASRIAQARSHHGPAVRY